MPAPRGSPACPWAASCSSRASSAARRRGSPAWLRLRRCTAAPTPRSSLATATREFSSPSSPARTPSPSCPWPSCSAASPPAAACSSAVSTSRTRRSSSCKAWRSCSSSRARPCTAGSRSSGRGRPNVEGLGLWGVPVAVLGGAIRVSTPFLFVSLGECITERSGRINLGLEGILVSGAMAGYAVSLLSGSPWIGVLAAGGAGLLLGLLHGLICNLPRVNDIAVGIGLMLFGTGLAFFLGKAFVQPKAPTLPAIPFGTWSGSPQVRAALDVNPLFLVGIALALALGWAFRNTRWGLVVRMVGDSADAARAMGHDVARVRLVSTGLGGFLSGVGGSFLSLYYPGSWSEGLSSGQGLMAVALVIFARWNPLHCFYAALLFGGAGALGPALQSVGFTSGYYLFNAAPYVVTLAIMIATCSPRRTLAGAPGELSINR